MLCELCITDFPDHCPIDINEMCDCSEGNRLFEKDQLKVRMAYLLILCLISVGD